MHDPRPASVRVPHRWGTPRTRRITGPGSEIGRVGSAALNRRAGCKPLWRLGFHHIADVSALEDFLRPGARSHHTPITVDEVTTHARVEAAWTQLRRTYVVDRAGMTLTEEFLAHSRNGICAWPAFEPILRAGGSTANVSYRDVVEAAQAVASSDLSMSDLM